MHFLANWECKFIVLVTSNKVTQKCLQMSINYLLFFQICVFFLLLAACSHLTLYCIFKRAHHWCLLSVSIWINLLESCSYDELVNLLTENQYFLLFVPVVDLSVYEINELFSTRSVSWLTHPGATQSLMKGMSWSTQVETEGRSSNALSGGHEIGFHWVWMCPLWQPKLQVERLLLSYLTPQTCCS